MKSVGAFYESDVVGARTHCEADLNDENYYRLYNNWKGIDSTALYSRHFPG